MCVFTRILKRNKHFQLTHQTSVGHVWTDAANFVCMCPLIVPVFISVDSPDHSDGDAHSCQYERPHWEVITSNGEPRKRQSLNKLRLGATEACLPGCDSDTDMLGEGSYTHSCFTSSHTDHNVLFSQEKESMVFRAPGKAVKRWLIFTMPELFIVIYWVPIHSYLVYIT